MIVHASYPSTQDAKIDFYEIKGSLAYIMDFQTSQGYSVKTDSKEKKRCRKICGL